jgi:lipopolysaccharide transport system permease protein
MIVNLYKHRGYIWRTAWAELRTKYAGSSAGILWNLLQPLSQIAVYSLIFTSIIGHQVADVPGGYTVYLCSLLIPWMAFSECISRGTMSFVSHAQYLVKLPIPEQVFMAQTIMSSAMTLVISYSIFLMAAILLGQPATWHWALLPLPLGFMLAFAFGISLLLGTINAFIRDTATVVGVILQIGFWMYPVIYKEESLPPWLRDLIPWNPLYPSFTAIRDLALYERLPSLAHWLQMTGWAALACAAGYLTLRRLRPELRDVL